MRRRPRRGGKRGTHQSRGRGCPPSISSRRRAATSLCQSRRSRGGILGGSHSDQRERTRCKMGREGGPVRVRTCLRALAGLPMVPGSITDVMAGDERKCASGLRRRGQRRQERVEVRKRDDGGEPYSTVEQDNIGAKASLGLEISACDAISIRSFRADKSSNSRTYQPAGAKVRATPASGHRILMR